MNKSSIFREIICFNNTVHTSAFTLEQEWFLLLLRLQGKISQSYKWKNPKLNLILPSFTDKTHSVNKPHVSV